MVSSTASDEATAGPYRNVDAEGEHAQERDHDGGAGEQHGRPECPSR
jgi:hypothetical protein